MADDKKWTNDSLFVYFSAILAGRDETHREREKVLIWRIEELEKFVLSKFEASDKAITKAEAANERRFDAVNEFREALSDQTQTFIPRQEAMLAIERNSERMREMQGRLGGQIQNTSDRLNAREERGAGLLSGWWILVAFVGMLGTLGTFYIALHH